MKTQTLSLGPRGESLIKSFEKLSLVAYMPTPNDQPTIGWGHTGKDVKIGDTITKEMAEIMFTKDIEWAENSVRHKQAILTQSMFDALVSLVFNVGPGCLTDDSTIGGNLPTLEFSNSGGYFRAWAGFALWRKQGGKDLLGLARRRAKEMELFLEDGIPGA